MKNKLVYAFTLIELLVVMAIIAVIASILLPVIASVRNKARQTACLSNARQIGIALTEYTQDNDEHYMTSSDNDAGDIYSSGVDPNPAHFQSWYDYIQPYIKSYDLQKCPSYSGEYPVPDGNAIPNRFLNLTYPISLNVIWKAQGALSEVPEPSSTLLIAESPSGFTCFADFAPGYTATDWIMCKGEMHHVDYLPGEIDDWGDPAINAYVTGIAVDGHVKLMHMENTNGGGVTMDANGVVHDPPGGWSGLYVTGSDGSLSF